MVVNIGANCCLWPAAFALTGSKHVVGGAVLTTESETLAALSVLGYVSELYRAGAPDNRVIESPDTYLMPLLCS
jgi:hypothetical protein